MKTIYFVSGNPIKYKYFSQEVQIDGVVFEPLKIDVPEIQAHDNKTIAEFAAEWVANKENMAVIKEDVGLYIKGLHNFPGPFLRYAEEWFSAKDMLTMLEDGKDREAYWEFAVSYCEPGKKPVSFSTISRGRIALEPAGESGFIVDKIFIPEGENKTFAELLDDNNFHRNGEHYVSLRNYLESSL